MKLFNFTICNNHKIIEILGIKIKLKYSNNTTVKRKNCIAIVTNSGIGDYLLCSPYLKYIKKKYKSNYIIFFARGMVFNLLKKYNYETYDEIINYEKNNKYIKDLNKKLKNYQFDELIYLPSLKYDDKNWGYKLMRQLPYKINSKCN